MFTDSGRPLRIDLTYFRGHYGDSFPGLVAIDPIEGELPADAVKRQAALDARLQEYIDAVYDIFYGVADLWAHLDRQIYEDKTRRCYGLLVAWYIADIAPAEALGVVSSGGIPIAAKKIGGVDIKFAEPGSKAGGKLNADILQQLRSNAYGNKAYLMIKSATRVAAIRR